MIVSVGEATDGRDIAHWQHHDPDSLRKDPATFMTDWFARRSYAPLAMSVGNNVSGCFRKVAALLNWQLDYV